MTYKESALRLMEDYPPWDFKSYKGPDKSTHRKRVIRQAVSGFARALKAGAREGELKGQIDSYALYVQTRDVNPVNVMPPNVFAWGGKDSWNINGLKSEEAVDKLISKTGASRVKAEVMVKHLSQFMKEKV